MPTPTPESKSTPMLPRFCVTLSFFKSRGFYQLGKLRTSKWWRLLSTGLYVYYGKSILSIKTLLYEGATLPLDCGGCIILLGMKFPRGLHFVFLALHSAPPQLHTVYILSMTLEFRVRAT